LEKDDAIFQKNFLEDISQDQPLGCWSIQKDSAGLIAMLRNISWPGYVAFHRHGTREFGQIYIGEGIKNADLPFML